ncbi:MAG: hypothetical protein LBK13_07465 [Spirochaetales bacterium]|nr:hypothetical protein [Spirochaetales bacterium]
MSSAGIRTKTIRSGGGRPWLDGTGYYIIGDFGPSELFPALRSDIVIDNYHGPVGQALAEAAGAVYV